jgi:hypothetical protein
VVNHVLGNSMRQNGGVVGIMIIFRGIVGITNDDILDRWIRLWVGVGMHLDSIVHLLDMVEAFADSKLHNVSWIRPSEPRIGTMITYQVEHGKVIHKLLKNVLPASGWCLVDMDGKIFKGRIVPEEVQSSKKPSTMTAVKWSHFSIDCVPQVFGVTESTAKKNTESTAIEGSVGCTRGQMAPSQRCSLKSTE